MSDKVLREKLRASQGSPVYKDAKGKWRLAKTMVVTEMNVVVGEWGNGGEND